MKIGLCTVPPVEKEKSPLDIPLGLLSLAGMLEKEKLKVEIEIIDFFKLCKDKILKKDKYFCREAINFLLEKNFDIIGFSTMCLSYPLTLQIVDGCKNRDIIIILGGPEASLSDIETLKYFNSNNIYIVRGEGERTFLDLIKVFYSGNLHSLSEIKGITYKMNNKIIKNSPQELIKDLDELPFPSFHLYPYISEVEEVIIEIGRSCPYSCKYCSTSLHWGRKSRFKSPERVFSEIEYLKSNYGKSIFFFLHDCPTANKEYFIKLTSKIKELNIKFRCYARADPLNKEEINILKENGLNGIFYGIESGSSRMQSFIGKNLDVKNIIEVIKLTLNKKIMPTSSFIVGFPEEKYRDLEETFSLMLKIKLLGSETQCHMFTIFPETTFHKEYKSHLSYDGYISDMNSTILTKEDYSLIRKYKDIFSDFYFIPGFIKRDLIIASSLFYEFVSQFFLESIISLKYKDKYDFLHIVELWRKFLFNNKYIISFENFNPNFHLNEIFMYILTFFSSLIYSQKIKMSLLSREILKYQVAKNTLIFDNKKNYWMGTFNYKIPDLKIFINEKNEVEIKCPKVNIICIMNKIKGKLKIYILPMNKSFLLKNQNEKI
ncbi:MAG: radical SAM protein [Candidatus Micrarchaeia archaeon]